MSDLLANTDALLTYQTSAEIVAKMVSALTTHVKPVKHESTGFGMSLVFDEDPKFNNCHYLLINYADFGNQVPIHVHVSAEIAKLYHQNGGTMVFNTEDTTWNHIPTRVGYHLKMRTRHTVEETTVELIKLLDVIRV